MEVSEILPENLNVYVVFMYKDSGKNRQTEESLS